MTRRWLLISIMALLAYSGYANDEKQVHVRRAAIHEKPIPFARVVGHLVYGDKVSVEDEEGAWSRIRALSSRLAGWVYSSSLTKKDVKLTATDDTRTKASSGDLAHAGRGFSQEIEAEFRSNNPELDFTWIDRAESDPAFKVGMDRLKAFVKQGKLQVNPEEVQE